MSGIKETLEVIDFGLALATGIISSLSDDGKSSFADALNFGATFLALPAAFENISDLPSELSSRFSRRRSGKTIHGIREV